jgi:hypothetical protein
MDPLKVDDAQLQTVLQTLSKRPTSFWTTERVLQFLQILALICGAFWTLLNYLIFVRHEQDMKLAQDMFNLRAAELDNAIKEVTLHEAREGRITGLIQASVKPFGKRNLSTAVLSVRLTNTSKAPVEISWILLYWYLGTIDGQKGSQMPLRINPPPIDFIGEEEKGPITWKEYQRVGYMYPGTSAGKALAEFPELSFIQGGGATKKLLPGDSSGLEDYFLVKPIPGQWVGVVVVVGIDGGTSGDHLFHYVRLLPSTQSTEPNPEISGSS